MTNPDNPEFDALRAEHQSQFGISIAYIKRRVGAGTEYANEIARAVLSPHGGYYELAEMPEEFAGALGAGVTHRMVTRPDALETLARLERLVLAIAQGEAQPRKLSLYVLYQGGSLRDCRELFVLDYQRGEPLFAHGSLQSGVVPRFFKICLDASGAEAIAADCGLPASGVQFLLAPTHTDSGHCLLATLARAPGASDLGGRSAATALAN